MGKYGSGVSMKSIMLMEMDEVNKALDRATITDEDRKIVVDALQEAFYQWAMSNAAACAFEETVKSFVSNNTYEAITKVTIHSGKIEAKFNETYPDWDDDPLEDEEDGDETPDSQ